MNAAQTTMTGILAERRDDILRLAARYGARNVRVFGSVARGDADPHSDLDLLVKMDPDRSLFDLGGLVMDLRDLLGVRVDVVSEGSLYGRFGDLVSREAKPL